MNPCFFVPILIPYSQSAKAYHPGRGVYRSSYKNARRLAATETNIAYRTADHLRWQQLDFVVGIRVVLSNNHTLNGKPFRDICDDLSAPVGSKNTKGRGCYPKDFKFIGWHPLCRCHAESILKTEDEFVEDTERILQGEEPTANSVNTVSDVPQQFKDWIRDNKDRIDRAKSVPYFIRDNRKVVDKILGAATAAKPLLSPLAKLAMGIGVEVGKPMEHEAANIPAKYKIKEWQHTYSINDGGYIVIQKERIAEANASNAERRKFEKELEMCQVLADNGYKVEYLKGVNRPHGQTYDIRMNGMNAELKCITGGAGNIVKYSKKALSKQGGKAVVLELPNADKKYFDALAEARRKCVGRIFFYVKDENVLKEVK